MSIQARTLSVALAIAAAISALPSTAGVVVGNCGTWYSPDPPGGGAELGFDAFGGTTCTFELEYLPGMQPGDPVDLVFTAPIRGTYTFDTQLADTIINNTLFTWDDYHFALGMGFQASFVQFTDVTSTAAITPLNGATPFFMNPASSDVFTATNVSTHTVAFSGGTVPTGPGFVNVAVNVFAPTAGTFTLRQNFSVPEPTTIALLGLGLAGLAATRRRKLN